MGYDFFSPLTITGFGEISLKPLMPEIKRVVFNDPATIVFWSDGSKTVVKCQKEKGDTYSKETGLAIAIAKKAYGNKGNFNDIFTKWLGEEPAQQTDAPIVGTLVKGDNLQLI